VYVKETVVLPLAATSESGSKRSRPSPVWVTRPPDRGCS
jgi:hypothetical protein